MSLDLRNGQGEALAHRFLPADSEAVVVIAHGVTGQHDRPYLNDLADALSAAGLATVQFSFAGNGDSEGSFSECTISKEVEDLGSVIDRFEGQRLGYCGHSMGGAVGALRAAKDPRIEALCSLAGMVQVRPFMDTVFGHLTPGEAMLDKSECPLSPKFLEDAHRIGTTLEAAAQITVPWLLPHGTADELVPFSDSEQAAAACPSAQLVPIEAADHRFTGKVDELIDSVVPFFARHLLGVRPGK